MCYKVLENGNTGWFFWLFFIVVTICSTMVGKPAFEACRLNFSANRKNRDELGARYLMLEGA